ncbi:protein kinase [Streptomyces sp. FXJ1.4098]|nr:protein kinase [Streptomyces sp. FXJ1.4098]
MLRRPEHPYQAAVYRVEDDRGTHILKWYHRGHGPDRTVWELLHDRPRRHLTQFTETDETGAGGHPYDLVPSYGETDLARYLRDNPGPVDPGLIQRVVGQLHEALTTLHELNIVHRDLSPANVVLGSLDPDAPNALDLTLVDFAVSAYEPAERYTRNERWVGTALYMSPQASLRNQLIHPPADWWSLGMIVAEMAGGRHPVPFTDNDFVREEISSRAPDLALVTDARLRLLCMGLLTRDPEHRWGTDEVAQWLVGGRPPIAPWEEGTAPAHRTRPRTRASSRIRSSASSTPGRSSWPRRSATTGGRPSTPWPGGAAEGSSPAGCASSRTGRASTPTNWPRCSPSWKPSPDPPRWSG